MSRRSDRFLQVRIGFVTLFLLLAACTPGPANEQNEKPTGSRLKVVATTTILSDVIKNIAHDSIQLTTLLSSGVDPHTYEPKPGDIVALNEADILFSVGWGLDSILDVYLAGINDPPARIIVSDGITPITSQATNLGDRQLLSPKTEEINPHVWLDPNNVRIWVSNITRELTKRDPQNAELYSSNSQVYLDQISDLDRWIKNEVSQIPDKNRNLITDHETFAYFAKAYGFQQIGTIIPGTSTLAEPDAAHIAQIENLITSLEIPAIFVEANTSPRVGLQIARDTGVKISYLYIDSLGKPGDPVNDYLGLMRYNVALIVDALR